MVIRNMTRQLALPIEIIGGETVRAEDGLALSSRNGYLSEIERAEAPHLYRLLNEIRSAIQSGETDTAKLENAAISELTAAGWKTDYVAVRQQSDLIPAKCRKCPTGGTCRISPGKHAAH
jgi:pantoate--beta-alanine ligase